MISDYLSKEERFSCIKAGALAFAGFLDAETGPLPQVKSAGVVSTVSQGVNAAKGVALLAALGAGIPLGVFSHVMARRIAGKRLREEELNEKIKLYRAAADDLAAELPAEGGM